MIEVTTMKDGNRVSLLVDDIQLIRDMGGEKTLIVLRYSQQGTYYREPYDEVIKAMNLVKSRSSLPVLPVLPNFLDSGSTIATYNNGAYSEDLYTEGGQDID